MHVKSFSRAGVHIRDPAIYIADACFAAHVDNREQSSYRDERWERRHLLCRASLLLAPFLHARSKCNPGAENPQSSRCFAQDLFLFLSCQMITVHSDHRYRCLLKSAQPAAVPACNGQCLQRLSSNVAPTVMTMPSCISNLVSCTGVSANAHACMTGHTRAKLHHCSALLQMLGRCSCPAPPPTKRVRRGRQAL